ncbi:MAG: hydroxymethylglutaryl-CoA lyase [Alphaproteobacteria bacterium]|nr:hydroxymethylglutaryl-CoA lyase [Alphaproteobacteria bacterium]
MPDFPRRIDIQEEGPREGFQFEKGPIPTDRKIALIDALSDTGLSEVQIGSYVNPKRVPGWADVDDVVAGIRRKEGVRYTVLWLNERGLERALAADGLYLKGSITTSASETFMKLNQNRGFEDNIVVQYNQVALYKKHGIDYFRGSMMAAFGCNFEGDVPVAKVIEQAEVVHRIAAENDVALDVLSLADTMAWATPESVKRVVGAVRERWPELRLTLHLHDTRGLGVANAYAGLEMGVDSFDASVAGLGGCPFAGHRGAAGNVCTEDLAFMCEEMGIETGIDLERLLDAARLAEDIVGHDLPGAVKCGGSLKAIRRKLH